MDSWKQETDAVSRRGEEYLEGGIIKGGSERNANDQHPPALVKERRRSKSSRARNRKMYFPNLLSHCDDGHGHGLSGGISTTSTTTTIGLGFSTSAHRLPSQAENISILSLPTLLNSVNANMNINNPPPPPAPINSTPSHYNSNHNANPPSQTNSNYLCPPPPISNTLSIPYEPPHINPHPHSHPHPQQQSQSPSSGVVGVSNVNLNLNLNPLLSLPNYSLPYHGANVNATNAHTNNTITPTPQRGAQHPPEANPGITNTNSMLPLSNHPSLSPFSGGTSSLAFLTKLVHNPHGPNQNQIHPLPSHPLLPGIPGMPLNNNNTNSISTSVANSGPVTNALNIPHTLPHHSLFINHPSHSHLLAPHNSNSLSYNGTNVNIVTLNNHNATNATNNANNTNNMVTPTNGPLNKRKRTNIKSEEDDPEQDEDPMTDSEEVSDSGDNDEGDKSRGTTTEDGTTDDESTEEDDSLSSSLPMTIARNTSTIRIPSSSLVNKLNQNRNQNASLNHPYDMMAVKIEADDTDQLYIHMCSICQAKFSTEEDLGFHMDFHKNYKKGCSKNEKARSPCSVVKGKTRKRGKHPFKCVTCNKGFKREKSFKRHLDRHSSPEYLQAQKLRRQIKRSTNSKDSVTCTVCGLDCVSPSRLRDHTRKHTGEKPYQCEVCGKKFVTQPVLRRHAKEHDEYKPYPCTICPKSFAAKANLLGHIRLHERKNTVICPICGKAYRNQTDLKIHERSHTGEKPFSCGVCGKSFVTNVVLRRHERGHAEVRPFQCPICPKRFAAQVDMRSHMRAHPIKDLPLQCYICSYDCRDTAELSAHIETHGLGRKKNFQCDLCGRISRNQSEYDIHQRRHTGEKPFVCQVCGKSFVTNVILRKHLRSHAEDKPYQCEVCPKRFAAMSDMRSHMRSHPAKKLQESILKFNLELLGQMKQQEGHGGGGGGGGGDLKILPPSTGPTAPLPGLPTNLTSPTKGILLNCVYCGYESTNGNTMRVHEKNHENGKFVHCTYCGQLCTSRKALAKHEFASHNILPNPGAQETNEPAPPLPLSLPSQQQQQQQQPQQRLIQIQHSTNKGDGKGSVFDEGEEGLLEGPNHNQSPHILKVDEGTTKVEAGDVEIEMDMGHEDETDSASPAPNSSCQDLETSSYFSPLS